MMDGGKQKSLGKGGDQDWCRVIICNHVKKEIVHEKDLARARVFHGPRFCWTAWEMLCGIATCGCR